MARPKRVATTMAKTERLVGELLDMALGKDFAHSNGGEAPVEGQALPPPMDATAKRQIAETAMRLLMLKHKIEPEGDEDDGGEFGGMLNDLHGRTDPYDSGARPARSRRARAAAPPQPPEAGAPANGSGRGGPFSDIEPDAGAGRPS